MSDLHTTVIMKTDLRGSTPLYQGMVEDQLREFLQEHKSLISRLVTQSQGNIVKGEGDAFWITFASVTAAVQVALQIQQALVAHQAGIPDDKRVAVRIVIAAGDVLHHNNDIFGLPVNLTARIEGITPANEIYLSQAAWLLLNQAGFETALVGEFALKGIAQPEKIYRIVQAQRTVLLPNQIIVSLDTRRFSIYQKSASTLEIENFLLQLEKVVKTACETYEGTVRIAGGDTFVLTFADVLQALPALVALCEQWDAYIQAHRIPCPLAVGVHQGQMSIFRLFAYGEDLYVAIWLTGLMGSVRAEATTSSIAVSGNIRKLVNGTPWEKQLVSIARDKMSNKLQLTGYAAYELERKPLGDPSHAAPQS